MSNRNYMRHFFFGHYDEISFPTGLYWGIISKEQSCCIPREKA